MSSTFREEDNGTVEIDLVPDVNTTLEECSLVCKLPGVTVVTRLITLVRIVFVLMGTARVGRAASCQGRLDVQHYAMTGSLAFYTTKMQPLGHI